MKPFGELKAGDQLKSKHTGKVVTLTEPYMATSQFGAAWRTDDPKHIVWQDNYDGPGGTGSWYEVA